MSSTKGAKGKEKITIERTLMISKQTLKANKPYPAKTLEAIPLIHGDDKRQVHVGNQLKGLEKEEIIKCL